MFTLDFDSNPKTARPPEYLNNYCEEYSLSI